MMENIEKYFWHWLVAALCTGVIFAALVNGSGGWDADAETDSIGIVALTPTPVSDIGRAAQAFRCQEDEAIIIILGDNGLPFVTCIPYDDIPD